jgi:hypothetical protein
MRILIHPMHTSCDYELAKTGHQFYAPHAKYWDGGQRPKPDNWYVGGTALYDACIVGTEEAFGLLRNSRLPMIYYQVCNLGEGPFNAEIERRCSAVVFTCREVADRWQFRDPSKKRVIEQSIDTQVYAGHRGDGGDVLTVANCYPRRPAQWYDWLLQCAGRMNLHLVGAGNAGVACAKGHALDYEDLKERYRQYKVYLNPATDLSMAVLEAMATGIPLVTFSPITYRDLAIDGENCFVVANADEAVARVEQLLADPGLRSRMGAAGRNSVAARLTPEIFSRKWNELLQVVAR